MDYGNTVGSLRQILASSRGGEIIFGSLLGDGHLAKLKNGIRFEACHCIHQKEYLFWKYQELKDFTGAQPHCTEIWDKRYKKRYKQYRFKTKIHPFFNSFYKFFYGNKGKKEIRKEFSVLFQSPLSLAVWFMDDGGRRNDSYGIFLNTLSFTLDEHKILQTSLRKNFSLDSRIHWVQDGYRLYIPSKNVKYFSKIVYPYILSSMKYKLPYNPVTTSFARLDRARDRDI